MVAILIDSADPDWRHTAARIIEFLATLWGGRYSLVVPTDGASISTEFWAQFLSSFDPDYLSFYRKTGVDTKTATPSNFEALL